MAKGAKKTKDELRGMSEAELTKKLATLREDLRKIHFKAEGAKSKNVKESLALRRQIARTLTAINSK